MLKFHHDKIIKEEILAKGSNSIIYPYGKSKSDNKWVVKHIHTKTQNEFLPLIKNLLIGFNCQYPNIVSFEGCDIVPRDDDAEYDIYIKMPRMIDNLNGLINEMKSQNKTSIQEQDAVEYTYSLVNGLKYLHEKGLAHKNIKASNVLIDKERKIKLSDIGANMNLTGTELNHLKNNPEVGPYIAPEIINQEITLTKQDFLKSDVWSLGMIIVELCLLKPDYLNELDNPSTAEKALDEIQEKYSSKFANILKGMICRNPEERKTIKEIHQAFLNEFSSILVPNDLNNKEFFQAQNSRRNVMV